MTLHGYLSTLPVFTLGLVARAAASLGTGVGALPVFAFGRVSQRPQDVLLAGREGPAATHLRRTWLFVIAITLHNFPEGMAVGVGFGGGDVANGLALTSAIFVQNLPEGFVVALGLLAAGYRKPFAIFASFAGDGCQASSGRKASSGRVL